MQTVSQTDIQYVVLCITSKLANYSGCNQIIIGLFHGIRTILAQFVYFISNISLIITIHIHRAI